MSTHDEPLNGTAPLDVKPPPLGSQAAKLPIEWQLACGLASEMRRLAKTPNQAMKALVCAIYIIHRAEAQQQDDALIGELVAMLKLLMTADRGRPT